MSQDLLPFINQGYRVILYSLRFFLLSFLVACVFGQLSVICAPDFWGHAFPETTICTLPSFLFIKENIYLFIWLHWIFVVACGIFRCGMWDLVPWPGTKPVPPALEVWSLNNWTAREVFNRFFKKSYPFIVFFLYTTWHAVSSPVRDWTHVPCSGSSES